MHEHLVRRICPQAGGAAGLGTSGYDAALAKRWEQELARGGWTGLGWPTEYGGRNLPLAQQIIFHEEYVRCGGPGRIGHIGEAALLAPDRDGLGHARAKQRFFARRAGRYRLLGAGLPRTRRRLRPGRRAYPRAPRPRHGRVDH